MIKFVFPLKAISKDNEKIMSRSGRFFKSKKYVDFEDTIKYMFLQQKPKDWKEIDIECFTILKFYFSNNVYCDLFNCPKSIIDALQSNKKTGFTGIWKNDKLIADSRLMRFVDSKVLPSIELYVYDNYAEYLKCLLKGGE